MVAKTSSAPGFAIVVAIVPEPKFQNSSHNRLTDSVNFPISLALPQKSESLLDTVSTTCDSGWVRSRAATAQSLHKNQRCGHFALTVPTCLRAAHPPAIAGGTDCVQARLLTFEARPISLLIQNPQAVICRIRLHGRLIHQFRAGGCDLEFAGHLDAHRVLQRRVTVKVIHEDRRAVVAELTIAVPVAPIGQASN